MNILFDLVSTQTTINGGGEYVKTVFLALVNKINEQHLPVKVFFFFFSKDKMAFDDLHLNLSMLITNQSLSLLKN